MTTRYSDLNLRYTEGQSEVLTDANALNQALSRLLTTPIGSVPFNREYGSSLYNLISEPQNDTTRMRVQVAISNAISVWEPRIRVERMNINEIENGYQVSITYVIIGLPSNYNTFNTEVKVNI